ncbi:peptidase M61 [Thalassotalea insulae]|uniref:Peptidase M61 n=1 Tax=Thalassotalea insulae TaxID=2056778 RepID=A0ABQ6GS62_9GAMM|nr:PDZ domain-containing protein [Thalassotalea insulae]GLX78232.1 peptidase M61 [Thalassotalea insulae]
MTIHYQIKPSNLNSHLFEVSIHFQTIKDKEYTLSLPAWLPGSYMIRDFAKNIISITAQSNSQQAIEITPLDKQSWQLIATDNVVEIKYQVFAFDLSVRTAYLDSQRGFFNGSSCFLAINELTTMPCKLTIIPADSIHHWRVATGMPRAKSTEKYQFGDYLAQDYAQLIDCPVALGDFDSFEFEVEGVTHHMVFTSEHYGDRERIVRDVSKLCQHHISLFGEAPFSEYWFITHLLAKGFGGLEHKNSTILQASRFDLPNPNKPEQLTDEYKTFLSLCSHEYFHAWNVCRIKPKAFVPYQLAQESYTEQLWAYEGITSYYDDFSLYRAGIISFSDYLQLLAKTATRVYRGKGELKQSVLESSFYTWTKFYQQGPDAVNNIVSYYTKGALIALWLDLTIRSKSQGQYSLDNLMRELWMHFGRPGIGTEQQDFINIANILCGEDIGDALTELLQSAQRIELAPLLAQVGVSFTPCKFKLLNNLETTESEDYCPYLGAQYTTQPLGVKISQVSEDSPATIAGLAVNDVLVAVNGLKITDKSLQSLAEHLTATTKVSCHYFRDDQLIISELAFTDSPLAAITLTEQDAKLSENWRKIIS